MRTDFLRKSMLISGFVQQKQEVMCSIKLLVLLLEDAISMEVTQRGQLFILKQLPVLCNLISCQKIITIWAINGFMTFETRKGFETFETFKSVVTTDLPSTSNVLHVSPKQIYTLLLQSWALYRPILAILICDLQNQKSMSWPTFMLWTIGVLGKCTIQRYLKANIYSQYLKSKKPKIVNLNKKMP